MDSIEPAEARSGRIAGHVANGVLLAAVGAFLSLGATIVWCVVVESRPKPVGGPVIASGQAFFFVTLPMSAMIGASLGFTVACYVARRAVLGALLSFSLSAIFAAILFRVTDFRLGFDVSQQILYGPLIAGTVILLVCGLLTCALLVSRQIKRVSN